MFFFKSLQQLIRTKLGFSHLTAHDIDIAQIQKGIKVFACWSKLRAKSKKFCLKLFNLSLKSGIKRRNIFLSFHCLNFVQLITGFATHLEPFRKK